MKVLGDDKGFVTILDFSSVFKEINNTLVNKSKREFERFYLKNSQITINWRKKIHKEEIFSIRVNPQNNYLMTTSIDKNVFLK